MMSTSLAFPMTPIEIEQRKAGYVLRSAWRGFLARQKTSMMKLGVKGLKHMAGDRVKALWKGFVARNQVTLMKTDEHLSLDKLYAIEVLKDLQKTVKLEDYMLYKERINLWMNSDSSPIKPIHPCMPPKHEDNPLVSTPHLDNMIRRGERVMKALKEHTKEHGTLVSLREECERLKEENFSLKQRIIVDDRLHKNQVSYLRKHIH